MSYQVLARKYRPRTFDDVLGQEHVVRTLRNAIQQNRLAHAYLFVGPRGTGKTSTARILAKALNCPGGPMIEFNPDDPICIEIAEGRSMDVLEIDGASNNGIDQVRDLRDTVRFAPMKGQFRIVYIDEVHMLSAAAFNGLLKVLEEPPPHAKFIFATTDPQKVLPTILSRCQRFDLRRIPDPIIADHLLHIANLEGLSLDAAAAHAIARGADGGMRDAQSMLDQLVAFCGNKIAEEDVLNIFGFTSHETIAALSNAILAKETAVALEKMHVQADLGKDLTRLLADLIGHFRNLLVHAIDPSSARDLAPAAVATLNEQAALVKTDRLVNLIDQFADVDARMKWASNKRLYLEIGLIKAIRSLEEVLLSDVIMVLQRAADGTQSGTQAMEAAPVERTKAGARAPSPGPPPAAPAAPTAAADDAAPGASGAELWRSAQAELQTRKPMLAAFAAHGVFQAEREGELVIGFSPASQMARDSLNRPTARAAVEEILAALSGRALSLKLETRDDVQPPPTPTPPPAAENPVKPPPALDDFYSDPLIAEALTIFEAKITSIKRPPGSNGQP